MIYFSYNSFTVSQVRSWSALLKANKRYRSKSIINPEDTFVLDALSKKIQLSLNFLKRITLSAMSTKYASRYEAVFLCTHPKMSQLAAAKYMKKSKSFVQKWVRYNVTKNVDDLPERGSICKVDKKR